MRKEKLKADSAGAVVERVRRGGDRWETSCGSEWACETSCLFGDNNNGGERRGFKGVGRGGRVFRLREGVVARSFCASDCFASLWRRGGEREGGS